MHTHAIPYRAQEHPDTLYYCGPAIVQMLLAARGHERPQSELAEILGTDKTGTKLQAIQDFLFSTGFSVKHKNQSQFSDIEAAIAEGATVVVGYIEQDENRLGHYGIVRHLDPEKITLIDPLLGPDVSMNREEFESRWHDDSDNSYGERMMMAVYFPDANHQG